MGGGAGGANGETERFGTGAGAEEQGASPAASFFLPTCPSGKSGHKWWAGWHPKTQLPRYPGILETLPQISVYFFIVIV